MYICMCVVYVPDISAFSPIYTKYYFHKPTAGRIKIIRRITNLCRPRRILPWNQYQIRDACRPGEKTTLKMHVRRPI